MEPFGLALVKFRSSLSRVFILIIVVLSMLVTAVSFVVWLFFFFGVAMSRGVPVGASVFRNMQKAGWTALVSFWICILGTVTFVLSYQN